MKTATKKAAVPRWRRGRAAKKKRYDLDPERTTAVVRGQVVQLVPVLDPMTGDRWAEVFDAEADRLAELADLSRLAIDAKAGRPSEE